MSRHPAAAGFVCDEALASVADRVLGDHDPRVDRAVAAIPLRTHRARVPRVLPLPCGHVGFTFRTPMISNEVFVRNFRTPTRFLLTRPKTTIVSDLPLARSTPTRSRGRGLWMRTMREVPVIGFYAMYGSFVSMTGISFFASRRSLSFITISPPPLFHPTWRVQMQRSLEEISASCGTDHRQDRGLHSSS